LGETGYGGEEYLNNILHGIIVVIVQQNAITGRQLAGCGRFFNGFD
jgi:hypothetical protein